jgi:hypothetical protein
MTKTFQVGDEYYYTVDGKTNKFKVVECKIQAFDGDRVYSVRWVESKQAWTKAITSHNVEYI